mmetsp:Transcript_33136/g.53231  ORF Transcript_33136/g.53231 Transcript_33136/m.53231 type:complete len:87 (-) Transcript_33136:891-1151(-)
MRHDVTIDRITRIIDINVNTNGPNSAIVWKMNNCPITAEIQKAMVSKRREGEVVRLAIVSTRLLSVPCIKRVRIIENVLTPNIICH